MEKIKVLEDSLYYIAGEFAVYRVLGGHLSALEWLKEYSDIEQVIATKEQREGFVLTLMLYYSSFVTDINWPHRK